MQKRILLFVMVIILFTQSSVQAAGITLHLFMADQAIESAGIPDLKNFLRQQKNSIRNGAMFPDSGYLIENSYGEFAHWEHFHNGYLSYLEENCAWPLSSKCEALFGFFLGTLSHALSDVNFHRDFIPQVADRDFQGDYQKAHDYSDVGMDMLAIFDYGRGIYVPTPAFPIGDLLKIFELAGAPARKSDLDMRTTAIYSIYLAERFGSALSYFYYKTKASWAPKNYYAGPGGVLESAKEIVLFWEKLWQRYQERHRFADIGKFSLIDHGFPHVEIVLE